MSFFDPVYQSNAEPINDDESDNETSNNGFQRRQTSRDTHNDESNETLDALPMAHASMGNGPDEEDGRAEVSKTNEEEINNEHIELFRFRLRRLLNESNRFKARSNRHRRC